MQLSASSRRGNSAPRRTMHDKVCVVIPAFNEAVLIKRCIDSVIAAGVEARDIYVVDDASTDETRDIVWGFSGINMLTNTRKRGKMGGIADAITHFHLAERYEYFAILDADSHVAPDYFTEILVRFMEHPNAVLVCGTPQSERHNWLTAYRAYEYAVTLRLYRRGQHAMGVITVAPGCASVYRTRVLHQLQWDSQTLVEDMDLTVQIHRRNLGEVVYAPHAVAYTQDPRTLRDYVGQLTRWYRGTWQVMRLREVPFGGQRIDAEFALLLGEGVLFAAVTLCVPLLLWLWPAAVLRVLAFDQVVATLLAVWCAVTLRRVDVLKALPTFPFLRIVNSAILLRTFWSEVVRGEHTMEWFSVNRYGEEAAAAKAERALLVRGMEQSIWR